MENYYIKQVHDMSELEMERLLEEIAEVCDNNKWDHLVLRCFRLEEEALEDKKIQILRGKIRDIEMNASELEHDARSAVQYLDKIKKQK